MTVCPFSEDDRGIEPMYSNPLTVMKAAKFPLKPLFLNIL
jgi:hypothetical protein